MTNEDLKIGGNLKSKKHYNLLCNKVPPPLPALGLLLSCPHAPVWRS